MEALFKVKEWGCYYWGGGGYVFDTIIYLQKYFCMYNVIFPRQVFDMIYRTITKNVRLVAKHEKGYSPKYTKVKIVSEAWCEDDRRWHNVLTWFPPPPKYFTYMDGPLGQNKLILCLASSRALVLLHFASLKTNNFFFFLRPIPELFPEFWFSVICLLAPK